MMSLESSMSTEQGTLAWLRLSQPAPSPVLRKRGQGKYAAAAMARPHQCHILRSLAEGGKRRVW